MSLKQVTRNVLCPFLYPVRSTASRSCIRYLHVSHAHRAPPPPPSTTSTSSARTGTAQDAPPVEWHSVKGRSSSPFARSTAEASSSSSSGTPPPPPPPTTIIVEEEITPFSSLAVEEASRTTEAVAACSTLSPQSPSAPRSQKPSSSALVVPSVKADALQETASLSASAGVVQGKAKQEQKEKHALPDVITSTTSRSKSKKGMALKPQRAAITLTPGAIERLKSLLDSPSGPRLIRIGVKNKGCAGMSYHLEYVKPEEAGRFDERVKQDGVEVLVDSKALFSIIGSEMDWQEDRLSAKFVFNNPNVTEACGCGESWTTI